MKKQLLILSILYLLIGTAQATNPAFLKVRNAVTKTALNSQTSHSSSSRATASPLLAQSFYSWGDFSDSTKYFYNSNLVSFLEDDAFLENYLGIWKYDSSVYIATDSLPRYTVKRTLSGSQIIANKTIDYHNNMQMYDSFSYNTQGKVSQILSDDAPIGGTLTTSWGTKLIYTDTAAGLIDSLIGLSFTAGVLIEDYRVKFTYNAAQKLIKQTGYALNTPNWEFEHETIYTYDVSNRVVLTKTWHARQQGNGIELFDSTITAYVGSTIQNDTSYLFSSDTINFGRAKKTIKTAFDEPLLEIKNGDFDVSSSTWVASDDTTFNLYNSFQQIKKTTQWGWVNNYFYETDIVASITDETSSCIKALYPNPAINTLMIELTNPTSENVSIYVYDLSGRLVQSTESHTKDSLSVDISKFAIGNYILKVVGLKSNFVGQFVKTN